MTRDVIPIQGNTYSWKGEALFPILSVVSSGTRQAFKTRLRKLKNEITTTYLRQRVSPYFRKSSVRVWSVSVAERESSSVALHKRTYSGLTPSTGPSLAAASISFSVR